MGFPDRIAASGGQNLAQARVDGAMQAAGGGANATQSVDAGAASQSQDSLASIFKAKIKEFEREGAMEISVAGRTRALVVIYEMETAKALAGGVDGATATAEAARVSGTIANIFETANRELQAMTCWGRDAAAAAAAAPRARNPAEDSAILAMYHAVKKKPDGES